MKVKNKAEKPGEIIRELDDSPVTFTIDRNKDDNKGRYPFTIMMDSKYGKMTMYTDVYDLMRLRDYLTNLIIQEGNQPNFVVVKPVKNQG